MDSEVKKEKSSSLSDPSKLDDPYAFLSISRNPDGSLARHLPFPDVPPNIQPPPPPPSHQTLPYVLSKDIPLNPSNHTKIRIYRPYLLSTPTTPLPVIIYFHGGGFILLGAATPFFHEFCERLAIRVPAIVLSVDFRLAPEHRLPAAYDDGMDAVRWVKEQAGGEPWMAPEIADLSRCFVMGCSAGGTIAYYVWHQLAEAESEEHPTLKIAGAILEQPFFGGVERTESEVRMAKDQVLPLLVTDLMWELALPAGANRDHEYSNPETLEKKKLGGGGGDKRSPCLSLACGKDPLVDRQRAVMKMVEEKGVKVVKVEGKLDEEGCHGCQLFEEDKKEMWLQEVKDFVSSLL